MAFFQVVEKDDFGTDWAPVRYNERALTRFETQEEAAKVAAEYITDRNVNNALTAAEKIANFECFMMVANQDGKLGCFLGTLDGKPWYLTHPKDVVDGVGNTKYAKGDIVASKTEDYRLEGKTEVAVRTLPGT